MHNLSEQAQQLIADFERTIATVPVEERSVVLKRMTSHICALNEDVQGVFETLQCPGYIKTPDAESRDDRDYGVDRVSDVL